MWFVISTLCIISVPSVKKSHRVKVTTSPRPLTVHTVRSPTAERNFSRDFNQTAQLKSQADTLAGNISQTASTERNPDRQLIIVPGRLRRSSVTKLDLLTPVLPGPAAPGGPQVMTLQLDTGPLLTPLIPTVFGLGAGLGWLLTRLSLTVSELVVFTNIFISLSSKYFYPNIFKIFSS